MALGTAYPSGGGSVSGAIVVDSTSFEGSSAPANGAYLPAANTVGIATDTTLRLSVSTTAVTSTLPIDGPDGSVSAPTFTNTGDLNTGMYFSAADTVDFAAGGVRALQLLTTASATNYLKVTPCTDGNNVELEIDGSGTDAGIDIHSKGSANIIFRSSGGSATQFGVNATASANNHLRVTGSNGGAPSIFASGGSTDIDVLFTPKGAGLVRFGTATASVATASTHQIAIKAADGTTYYLLATTVA